MKILKFLSGGQPTYSAITDPFSAPLLQAEPSPSASSGDDELIDKSLLKELSTKGIQSDFEILADKYSELKTKQSYGIPITASEYHNFLKEVNKVLRNGSRFEDVKKNAEKLDSFGEIAVSNDGSLYCWKDGQISLVSYSKYDPEKNGLALTVSDLIQLRETDKRFAFNQDVMETINSNLGMNKITDQIKNLINIVGSTSDTSEAYVTLALYIGEKAAQRPTKELLESLQLLSEAVKELGEDAVFKNRKVLESKNFETALAYIQSVLPRPVQLLLKGRFVAEGGEYENSKAYMNNIIKLALASNNEVKQEDLYSFDSSLNLAAGNGLSPSKKTHNLTGLEQLILGTLGKADLQLISSKFPDLAFTLHGTGLGQLMDSKNLLVSASIMEEALNTGLGALINTNNIQIGNLKLPSYLLDKIIYDGKDVVNILAPTDDLGNINFRLLELIELAKEYFRSHSLTPQEKINYLLEHNIEADLDANGNFITNKNMRRFIVVTGITSENAVDNISDNILSYKLTGADKESTLAKIKQIYALSNKGIKNKDGRYDFPTGWFDATTKLYAAPIFMELSDNAQYNVGTITGLGPIVNTLPYSTLVVQNLALRLETGTAKVLK